MADNDSNNSGGVNFPGLLKKAVSLGAGAYVSAEEQVNKTLNAAAFPKELVKETIRETLESFFQSYTIRVNAEINLEPKKKSSKE